MYSGFLSPKTKFLHMSPSLEPYSISPPLVALNHNHRKHAVSYMFQRSIAILRTTFTQRTTKLTHPIHTCNVKNKQYVTNTKMWTLLTRRR